MKSGGTAPRQQTVCGVESGAIQVLTKTLSVFHRIAACPNESFDMGLWIDNGGLAVAATSKHIRRAAGFEVIEWPEDHERRSR